MLCLFVGALSKRRWIFVASRARRWSFGHRMHRALGARLGPRGMSPTKRSIASPTRTALQDMAHTAHTNKIPNNPDDNLFFKTNAMKISGDPIYSSPRVLWNGIRMEKGEKMTKDDKGWQRMRRKKKLLKIFWGWTHVTSPVPCEYSRSWRVVQSSPGATKNLGGRCLTQLGQVLKSKPFRPIGPSRGL